MYCIEILIKNKRFFDYLKANQAILNDNTFDELKSSGNFETISKLKHQIQERFERNFDEQHKNQNQGFDFGKLDDMKKETNLSFFQKMSVIKTGGQTQDKQKNNMDEDILGLGETGFKSQNDKNKNGQKSKTNDADDDIFGIGNSSHKGQVIQSSTNKTNEVDDDIFGLGGNDQVPKIKPSYQQNHSNDDILGLENTFQISKNDTNLTKQQNQTSKMNLEHDFSNFSVI